MTDVTCAIIRDEEERILVVQRGKNSEHPCKWEFPGGKCRSGESYEDCIMREIREELVMEIAICSRLNPVEYDYGIKKIRLIPFVCDTLDDEPQLKEHIAYLWILPADLPSVDFLEADILVAGNYLSLISNIRKNQEDEGCRREKNETMGSSDEQELIDFINRVMSMKEADWLAEAAHANPDLFGKLLEYSLKDDNRLAFKASWILTKVCDKYPEIIRPHLRDVISHLPGIKNDSVTRSFMRILSFEDMRIFREEQHGLLASYCLSGLNSSVTPVAVKAYAMEILYRLTVLYPELGNEVSASIRSAMEEGSPGIISRGRAVLKKITGITSDS